jgi:hypothetical protein
MSVRRVISLSPILAFILLATAGEAAPPPASDKPGARLENAVEIPLKDVYPKAVCLLADNQSVVVVGAVPPAMEDGDPDKEPAAGGKTKVIRSFTNGHARAIQSAAVAADGSFIVTGATAADPAIRRWNVKANKALDPIDLSTSVEGDWLSFDVATFPKSNKVAVTLNKSIGIFDPAARDSHDELTADELKRGFPCRPTVSPDGKYLACATSKKYVLVWEVASKTVLCAIDVLPKGRDDYVNWHIDGLAFTRSGKELILCRGGYEQDRPKGVPDEKVPAERRGFFRIDPAAKTMTPIEIGSRYGTLHFALHPSDDWIATVGPAASTDPVPDDPDPTVGELRIYHYPTRTLAAKVSFPYSGFYPCLVGFTPDGKKVVALCALKGHEKVMAWDFTPVAK